MSDANGTLFSYKIPNFLLFCNYHFILYILDCILY